MYRSALAAALALGITSQAEAVELRLCESQIRTAPLSDERNVQSALVQGVAIINTGAEPARLTAVNFQLKENGQVRDWRRLLPADIERAVAQSSQIAALARILPSQFCNGKMLEGVKLATSETLAPGEAVVFVHQPFAWKGGRDQIEISATTDRNGVLSNDKISLNIVQGVSSTRLLFPVPGRSYVGVASSFHTPHRWAGVEEFAYDVAVLAGNGSTYLGQGTRLADYAAFGQAVRAAADGRVVAIRDGDADNEAMLKRVGESDQAYLARLQEAQAKLLALGMSAVLGNHVVIDHGNGEFSIYGHLKLGSILVAVGDRVNAGATIGLIGSSGNSTEPHLHFQMCDRADISDCRTIPAGFVGYRLPFELAPRSIQSGDVVETIE